MPRWIDVSVEFTWPLKVDGFVAAEIDCKATARVHRFSQTDYEVSGYRDIQVFAEGHWRDTAPSRLGLPIYVDLVDGAQDQRFIDAALSEGFGPNPDTVRDMKRETV